MVCLGTACRVYQTHNILPQGVVTLVFAYHAFAYPLLATENPAQLCGKEQWRTYVQHKTRLGLFVEGQH